MTTTPARMITTTTPAISKGPAGLVAKPLGASLTVIAGICVEGMETAIVSASGVDVGVVTGSFTRVGGTIMGDSGESKSI